MKKLGDSAEFEKKNNTDYDFHFSGQDDDCFGVENS